MNRQSLIEVLSRIQSNIEQVERQANQTIEQNSYYQIYGTVSQFEHRQEIKKKALAFWKRKFNQTLNQIKY